MVAVTLLFLVTARGFAAANTVSVSAAGDGTAVVSGYAVDNVKYTLGTGPTTISKVTFDVTPPTGAEAPTTVRAKLVSTSTSYATCSNTTSVTWECAISGVTVTQANELRVVAAE